MIFYGFLQSEGIIYGTYSKLAYILTTRHRCSLGIPYPPPPPHVRSLKYPDSIINNQTVADHLNDSTLVRVKESCKWIFHNLFTTQFQQISACRFKYQEERHCTNCDVPSIKRNFQKQKNIKERNFLWMSSFSTENAGPVFRDTCSWFWPRSRRAHTGVSLRRAWPRPWTRPGWRN